MDNNLLYTITILSIVASLTLKTNRIIITVLFTNQTIRYLLLARDTVTIL